MKHVITVEIDGLADRLGPHDVERRQLDEIASVIGLTLGEYYLTERCEVTVTVGQAT
jgi:hypothetical protein